MKRILLLLILITSFITKSQTINFHPSSSPAEIVFLTKAAQKYINDDYVTIIYQPYSPLNRAFNGVTYQYNKYLYQISLSVFRTDNILRTWALFHEVGHIIDFHKGRLEQMPIRWKGEEYKEYLDWKDRPWEKSAEKHARKLWKDIMGFPAPFELLNSSEIEFKCEHK